MKILSFGAKRTRRLIILLLVFFLVPIISFLPFSLGKILVFVPMLFWVNIVGLPLALIGVPFFEVHEFGAVPQGVTGYGLVVLVYCLAAFFLSLIGKAEEKDDARD